LKRFAGTSKKTAGGTCVTSASISTLDLNAIVSATPVKAPAYVTDAEIAVFGNGEGVKYEHTNRKVVGASAA
jgi:hypothetical protein